MKYSMILTNLIEYALICLRYVRNSGSEMYHYARCPSNQNAGYAVRHDFIKSSGVLMITVSSDIIQQTDQNSYLIMNIWNGKRFPGNKTIR